MAVDITSLAIAGTGVAFVLISTIFSISTTAKGLIQQRKQEYGLVGVYQDKDGVSTEELTAAYTTIVPKSVLGLFSLAGLGVATALAIHVTLSRHDDGFLIEDYLNVAAWAMILIQAAQVALSKSPSQIYSMGSYASVSCVFLVTVLFAQEVIHVQRRNTRTTLVLSLRMVQIAVLTVAGFAGALIQARPEVFTEDGKPIDGQNTRSILSKYTFDWVSPLLNKALKSGALEIAELPRPDHLTRSNELADAWIAAGRVGRLWLNVFLTHKWAFIFQWTLTLVQSFGNIAPQFMLFHIIKILEARDVGRSVTSDAWVWVIALGLSQSISSWVEAWLFWISFSKISGPIRAQLSALIFRKSMRRKDVKGDVATKKPADAEADAVETDGKKDDEGEEQTEKKSTQSTVNLIGVDTRRIAEFGLFNNFFPGAVFKLVVSFWFLIDIIGWRALGAGLISMAIIVPINIYFSKKYAAAQGRLMKIRDEKEAAVGEALKGVRQIKFSALENRWEISLNAIRSREIDTLWDVFVSDTALMFCWISSPVALSATALAVFSLFNTLTPAVAFTSIGVFNTLQVTLSVIPELTTDAIDAFVSINRVQKYLDSSEIDPSIGKDSPNVVFDNATFSFPSDATVEEAGGDERFTLRNVNLSFPQNELSIVSGKTGSGKSLLLAAILREVDIISGSVNLPHRVPAHLRRDDKATKATWIIPSAIAFVAQIPWIENATIKDNILFGLPFDQDRYDETIESCALRKDLAMLPDGESTEIGANGINLSGGQKWRLSFARALYSRAGILVLDDIFSAVDAHVGKLIFEKGLTGKLGQGRTRILVTHHVALCKSRTKYLVELADGTVQHAGLLSELEVDGTLSKIVSHVETAEEIANDQETAVNSEQSSDDGDEVGEALKKVDTKASARKFVEEETKEKGAVKARLYLDYLKSSGGWPFWSFAAVIFIGQQALALGRSWWLKLWTEANDNSVAVNFMGSSFHMQHEAASFAVQRANDDGDLFYWLGIYIAISFGSAFIGTFIFFYLFCGGLKASRDLFTRMLHTVLRAPLRWHDTVPLGRILNRFTADFAIVDNRLAYTIGFGSTSFLKLVGVVIAGFVVSPYVIILAAALAGVCVSVAGKYLVGAREVKRLESITKSPIFSQFGSTLSGIATIRAFDKTDGYVATMSTLIDDYTSTYWYLWLFNRWFTWRMSMIGGVFTAVVAGLVISLPNINASLSGFALFFALEYSGAITWTIRYYTNLELDMNAAERVVEYIKLPTESQEGVSPPAAWPTNGRLEVENLSVTYAPGLPSVLKNLTFTIERNQRVGVVGRTGAGKSSLTLALFRFLEAQSGSINIDGLDISKLKLEDLRSRLAIIPQDPVLFSGTIRSNLDPFDERSDAELYDSLRRVHLIPSDTSGTATPLPSNGQGSPAPTLAELEDTNKNLFKSLKSEISPSGLNLSQGQRQLLCLARAIVAHPKIMVLDEATSAVDMATDALIQRSIREEFTDSTLIVIAHRLSTIADFDKILVLDQGEVSEYGTPKELMQLENGVFRGMVGDSGEAEKLAKLILGN